MILRLDRLTAAYRGWPVFRDVHLTLGPGEVLGLIGPNGAGKSTLLRVIAGLIRPAGGRVERQGRTMYFGGEATLPGGCRADRWAGLFGAMSARKQPFRRLSRGTRQLEGLSAWLWRDDWVLGLLDEPWEGLDPDGTRWLGRELARHRDRGAATVVSSHRLHDVSHVCTSFAFLARGELRTMRAQELTTAGQRVDASDLTSMFDALRKP